MRWNSNWSIVGGGLWMLTAAACGGSAALPTSAETPEPPEAPVETEPKSPGVKPATPSRIRDGEEPAPNEDPGTAGVLGGTSSTDDANSLFNQFRSFEVELLQAGNACSRACRALRSMQHAAERLCDLAANAEQERQCHDARQRYLQARDRVRSSCNECPDGPAVDGDVGF